MNKVAGGHAIMLQVELSQSIINMTDHWVRQKPMKRQSLMHRAHCTIGFLGRSLPEGSGDKMHDAAMSLIRSVPKTLDFNGQFSMFGKYKNHLVALVNRTHELITLRGMLMTELGRHGLRVDSSFGFVPHISLALGTNHDFGIRQMIPSIPLMVSGVLLKVGDEYRSVGEVSEPQEVEWPAIDPEELEDIDDEDGELDD